MKEDRSRRNAARLAIAGLGFSIAGLCMAQGDIRIGELYQCAGNATIKVLSCAGPQPTDQCEVEAVIPGRAPERGPLPRQQIAAVVATCGPQTGAPGAAQTLGPDEPDRNGFRIGEEVSAATAGGFYTAKILKRNGDAYFVRFNQSAEVWKTYPTELRRLGPLNDMDRARGLFAMKEKVQVNVEGNWVNGTIIAEMGMDYNVEIPNNRTVWANAQNLRRVAGAAEAPAAKPGTPPKPGLTRCADKFNGRYSSSGGGVGPSLQFTFRSGKATMQDMSGPTDLECWSDGQRLYLHKVGESAEQDMPIEINDDGTLDTPFGEIKKKGK